LKRIYIAVLLLLSAINLLSCKKGESPEGKKSGDPTNFYEVDKDIKSVYYDGENAVEIVISFPKIWNEEGAISSFAGVAERSLGNAVKRFPEGLRKNIRFVLEIPVQDKYGNQSLVQTLVLHFSGEEIKKVKFQNINRQELLNLYDGLFYVTPLGPKLIAAFCRADYGKGANEFCAKELRRISTSLKIGSWE
jgi:hypothetical protein